MKSTLITEGIEVAATWRYNIKHSAPVNNQYIYSYHINIQNNNESHVQLLRREWLITDCGLTKRRIKGDGVIGLQPIIGPGSSHEYTSWCQISDIIGIMSGHYEMQNLSNDEIFSAIIPSMRLTYPPKLN